MSHVIYDYLKFIQTDFCSAPDLMSCRLSRNRFKHRDNCAADKEVRLIIIS